MEEKGSITTITKPEKETTETQNTPDGNENKKETNQQNNRMPEVEIHTTIIPTGRPRSHGLGKKRRRPK